MVVGDKVGKTSREAEVHRNFNRDKIVGGADGRDNYNGTDVATSVDRQLSK